MRILPALVSSTTTGPEGADGLGAGVAGPWASIRTVVSRIMPEFYRAPGTRSGPAKVSGAGFIPAPRLIRARPGP